MGSKSKTILKVFLVVAFSIAAVFPTHIALAEGSGYFFSSGQIGTGVYAISPNYLSVGVSDSDIGSTAVDFTITIKPRLIDDAISTADIPAKDSTAKSLKGFQYTLGTNGTSQTPTGHVDTETDLGFWDSIFSNDLINTPGEGLWLDYGPISSTAAICLTDTPTSSSCLTPISLVPFLLKTDSGVMRILSTGLSFKVRINGLLPGTGYQVRIRTEDEYDANNSLLQTIANLSSPGLPSSPGGLNETGISTFVNFTTRPGAVALATDQQTAESNSQNQANTIAPQLPGCGGFGSESSIMGCISQIIYTIIFKPTSYLMVLSGEIMDWGIGFSIDSASYPVSGHSFVTDGWRIMRDIVNILFIFILVFTAIGTILGKDNKKPIVMVILVALILNFSLFFTKVVVDFGNITARFFYNNISITNTQAGNIEIFGTSKHKSISYGFAAVFNPLKLFSGLTPQTTISSAGGVIHTGLDTTQQYAAFFAIFSFIGAIVNLVAAYVFFSLAWLFIARTAGIWLSMIFAPLAFLSLMLPSGVTAGFGGAKKYINMKTWRDNLVSLAVMPVIAMLMIFLILTFLKSPGLLGSLENNPTTTGQFMSVLIPLIVVSILLIQTKKTAEGMSGEFGAWMGKVGSFVGGAAIGVATGGAALIGRRTLGGLGARIANDESLKKSRFGRNLISAGRVMESSTYDFKNTKVAQFGLKKAGYNPNEYVNTTVKTGYKTQKENQIKKREDYKESMKLSENSAEGQAVKKAKEVEEKEKEVLDTAQKTKNEAQKDYLAATTRYKNNETEENKVALDAAEAELKAKEKAFSDKKDEYDIKATAHKTAKIGFQKTNATIVNDIADNVDTKLGFAKSNVMGSASGRLKTVENFRREAKKAEESNVAIMKQIKEAAENKVEAKAKKEKMDKEVEELKKKKKQDTRQPTKPYSGTSMGFAPNNTQTNNTQSNKQGGGQNNQPQNSSNVEFKSQPNRTIGNIYGVSQHNNQQPTQLKGLQNLGGVDDYRKTGNVNSNAPINISNSQITINSTGAVNQPKTQDYKGTQVGFKREPSDGDARQPIGFKFAQDSTAPTGKVNPKLEPVPTPAPTPKITIGGFLNRDEDQPKPNEDPKP